MTAQQFLIEIGSLLGATEPLTWESSLQMLTARVRDTQNQFSTLVHTVSEKQVEIDRANARIGALENELALLKGEPRPSTSSEGFSLLDQIDKARAHSDRQDAQLAEIGRRIDARDAAAAKLPDADHDSMLDAAYPMRFASKSAEPDKAREPEDEMAFMLNAAYPTRAASA